MVCTPRTAVAMAISLPTDYPIGSLAHTGCVTSLQGFVVPEEPRSYVQLVLSQALKQC